MNNSSLYLTPGRLNKWNFLLNQTISRFVIANDVIQSRSLFADSVQQPVQLQERTNTAPDRPYFTHDVKPEQKKVYFSDEYNQRDESKRNGSIPYIQGFKNNPQDRSSVLPKIHVCIKSLSFGYNIILVLSIHISFLLDSLPVYNRRKHLLGHLCCPGGAEKWQNKLV